MASFNRAAGFGKGSIETLLNYALLENVSVAQCLVGSGVANNFLNKPVDVSIQQELIVISNVLKLLGKPFFIGFSVGLSYKMADLGVVGLALMSGENGLHAANIIDRYQRKAYHFNWLGLVVMGSKVKLMLSPRAELDKNIAQFMVARDLGIFSMMQHSVLKGEKRNTFEIGFSFDYLKGMGDVADAFSCPVRHKQKYNYLVCDVNQLKLRPPLSNPINAAAIELSYHSELSKLAEPVNIVKKIEQYLHSIENLNVQKKQVAQQFNMSERTLTRHLEKQGLNWRDLLSGIRLKQAEYLLRTTDKSLQSISDQVGFASASSLSHAFTKHKNVSPSEFRKSHIEEISV